MKTELRICEINVNCSQDHSQLEHCSPNIPYLVSLYVKVYISITSHAPPKLWNEFNAMTDTRYMLHVLACQ